MKLDTLLNKKGRAKIAVIGSHLEVAGYADSAGETGRLITEHKHILLSGGCGGLPGLVSKIALVNNGISIAISPECENIWSDQILINTGFGFKGRNVILIRSADLVLCFPGGLGTINELTIALDENRLCYFVDQNLNVAEITKKNFKHMLGIVYRV